MYEHITIHTHGNTLNIHDDQKVLYLFKYISNENIQTEIR